WPAASDRRAPSRRRRGRCPSVPLGRNLREILADAIEIMLPALPDVLAVRFVQQADRAVTECDLGPARGLIQLDLDVVERGVGHKQGAAKFQQHWGLDYLHMPPEMADAVPAVTEPAAARPLLQNHMHGFA